jgi:hypothetical protein
MALESLPTSTFGEDAPPPSQWLDGPTPHSAEEWFQDYAATAATTSVATTGSDCDRVLRVTLAASSAPTPFFVLIDCAPRGGPKNGL